MTTYAQKLADEGTHWHNAALELVRQGTIPYSGDFRLHLAQLVLRREGRPFHLGAGLVPTRFREVRNVLGGAAERIHAGRRDVLDLGCGAGWLSLELARQGGNVLGLDVSKDNLAMASFFAERHASAVPHLYPRFVGLPLGVMGEVSYQYGDLNQDLAQVQAASHDVVTVWDSLHHVRDLHVTFREAARVLRPDGFLIGHDYVGPSPDAEAVRAILLPAVQDLMKDLSGAELHALRRTAAAAGAALALGENAVDAETRFPEATARYVEETLAELRRRFLDGRAPEPVASPFEEVSIAYLLSELERAFHVTAFYSMGAFWPEEMPPPPPDADEAGALCWHYLAWLTLALDDLVVDAGHPGRYVCFVAVPKGRAARTPALRRTIASPLATPAGAAAGAGDLARLRFLEAENRVLRRVLQAPPGPAADAHRFYFKVVRPFLRRLLPRGGG